MMQHALASHLQVIFVFSVFSVGRCGVRHMDNNVAIKTCGLTDTLDVKNRLLCKNTPTYNSQRAETHYVITGRSVDNMIRSHSPTK